MKNRRYLLIAVGAAVLMTAMVGFFITLDVSPQIAYARLFIDVGLGLGMMALVLAFFKEPELPVQGLINALSHLKNGKYQTRVLPEQLGLLQSLGVSINDLAKSLEDSFNRQEEIKRNLRAELLPNFREKEKEKEKVPTEIPFKEPIFRPEHSFHPELGPVEPIAIAQEQNSPLKEAAPKPLVEFTEEKPSIENPSDSIEPLLSNTLFQSNPPMASHPIEITRNDDEGVSASPSFYSEQDLGELYQEFIETQGEHHIVKTEYTVFLKTIETSRNELLSLYPCRYVHFDVVYDHNQVALQPRLIR